MALELVQPYPDINIDGLEQYLNEVVNTVGFQKKLETFRPYLTREYAQAIYELGEFLVTDDKHDLGYFSYYNRPHVYNGKVEYHHPSVWHHWPIGILLMVAGGILGVISNIVEMKDTFFEARKEMQAQAIPIPLAPSPPPEPVPIPLAVGTPKLYNLRTNAKYF